MIPVGKPEEIQCDGKYGGFYHWKGHDFAITLPPDCANGIVTITLKAYLPISTQEHCFVSAVFAVCAGTKLFKKSVSIQFPHWVNIKSEADKEKLYFLIIHIRDCRSSYDIQKGSFEIGEPSGSIEIEISEICHIFIFKKFAKAYFTFVEAGLSIQSELIRILSHITINILLDVEERSTTTAMSEAVEYSYLDMLLLPENHDRKWGIYCIAIDNPTYLQVTLGCLCNYSYKCKYHTVGFVCDAQSLQSINFSSSSIPAIFISEKQSDYRDLVQLSRAMACEVESEVESLLK